MKIKIEFPSGKVKELININETDTILEVKRKIGESYSFFLTYRGIALKDDKTIGYYGIEDDDNLFAKTFVSGGGGVNTVDITKNITNECEPAKSGPTYREGCNGLNIQAKCKNKNCNAYNDTIYVKIGYVQDWNLNAHLKDQVLCPSCGRMVKPKNYFFFECKYRIDYIKEVDDEYDTGYIEGSASGRLYKYFDEKESGNATFVELKFNVIKP